MLDRVDKLLEKKLRAKLQSISFTDFKDLISLAKKFIPQIWESIEGLMCFLKEEIGLNLPHELLPPISQQLKSEDKEIQEITCKTIEYYLLKEPNSSVKQIIFNILEGFAQRNHKFSLKTISNLTAMLYTEKSWSGIKKALVLVNTQKWFILQQKNLISKSCFRIIKSRIPKKETQDELKLLEQINPHLKSLSEKQKKDELDVKIAKNRFKVREYQKYFGRFLSEDLYQEGINRSVEIKQ